MRHRAVKHPLICRLFGHVWHNDDRRSLVIFCIDEPCLRPRCAVRRGTLTEDLRDFCWPSLRSLNDHTTTEGES